MPPPTTAFYMQLPRLQIIRLARVPSSRKRECAVQKALAKLLSMLTKFKSSPVGGAGLHETMCYSHSFQTRERDAISSMIRGVKVLSASSTPYQEAEVASVGDFMDRPDCSFGTRGLDMPHLK